MVIESVKSRSGWWGLWPTTRVDSCFSISRLQEWEAAHQGIVHGHQSSWIVELAAVIGRTEDSDELSTGKEFIAIFDDLMGTADKIDIVLLEELLYHGFTECIAHSSIILTPTTLGLLWVWPQQVAQETILGDFSRSSDLLELGDSNKLGREPSMHTKNLVVNQACHWQAVEDILELFPDSDAVSSLTFVVEAVDTVDLSTLMVPSEKEEVLFKFDFVG